MLQRTTADAGLNLRPCFSVTVGSAVGWTYLEDMECMRQLSVKRLDSSSILRLAQQLLVSPSVHPFGSVLENTVHGAVPERPFRSEEASGLRIAVGNIPCQLT